MAVARGVTKSAAVGRKTIEQTKVEINFGETQLKNSELLASGFRPVLDAIKG